MANRKGPYSFMDVISDDGKLIKRVTCEETGMITFLDPSITSHAATIREIEDSMAYEEKLEVQEDSVRSWYHERAKVKFEREPEDVTDNPNNAFLDDRYTPESQLFPPEKTALDEVADVARQIIEEAPENLKEFFFAHFGEGLSVSEIGRRDGVSETARRKYKKRLEKLVKDGLLAHYRTLPL